MPDKTFHGYDPATGEYQGPVVGQANALIESGPASSTDQAPPAAKAGMAACWREGAWVQVEDHRGETVYGGDDGRQEIQISELGPKADFGTAAPAALSDEEVATALQVQITAKVAAARAEQYERMAVSFWFTNADGNVSNAHVRCDQVDEASLNTFGLAPVLRTDAQWSPDTVWAPAEPIYDEVPLPTRAAANEFARAMVDHLEVWKVAFLGLMVAIQNANDLDALAAIDVGDDSHWPQISDPS